MLKDFKTLSRGDQLGLLMFLFVLGCALYAGLADVPAHIARFL